MIKLTRTDNIKLPSWEEFFKLGKRIYKRQYDITYDFSIEYNEFVVIGNSQIFRYPPTEQGYQQAIDKICELGNFKREEE